MKKIISLVTMATLVVSLGACSASSKDSEKDAKTETEAEMSISESEESETEEETGPNYQEGVWSMLDWANSNMQSRYDAMAFDDDYIYFQSDWEPYRCHYDGSGVEKLSKPFCTIFNTDGMLWGYSGLRTDDVAGDEGIVSFDPETGERTMIAEMRGSDYCPSVLVSGNWLVYVGGSENKLILYDLRTGKKKTISRPHTEGGELSNISTCLYGNTLYILFGTMPEKDSFRHEFMLASYELGSDAEAFTEVLTDLYPGGFKSSFWLEDGMLLLDTSEGSQYYHARFSDIDENGHWNYKTEENKVGTDMTAGDAVHRAAENIPFQFNSRYIIGDDLLFVNEEAIEYYEDFDFTKKQVLWDGKLDGQPKDACIGQCNGSVYVFLGEDKSDVHEIMKISEGGVIEHIPVELPAE